MKVWMENKYSNFYAVKFIVFCVLLIVLLSLGCEEQLTESPQELLVKPPADWIKKYGDGLESQQTANIVLAIQVINRQGEAIKQLDKRLVAIEIPKEAIAIIDPNGVK